jgi:hypothetical protein
LGLRLGHSARSAVGFYDLISGPDPKASLTTQVVILE